MMFFGRKFSNKRSSLIRAVALVSAGSGILCLPTSSNSETSVSVSLPPPLCHSLSWSLWRAMPENSFRHAFIPLNLSQHGFLPLFFSRPDALPESNTSKGAARDAGDSTKHSCNCFGRDTIANAASKVGPAVVNLSVPQGFHGMTVGRSMGSGTIIDKDGTILTCAHVVVDFQGLRSSSKGRVEVTLQDGRTFEGTVVNADLHSDIAIVKIKSNTPLPTAKLGCSSKLRPGDWVVAMGCPLTLQNTVTAGIVSCVDRKSSDLGLGGIRREYLQTDCAINEGNSGGPLVNVDGEIVGVNIMKVLGADGLNFAVPIDSVSAIVEHFKRNGSWKMVDEYFLLFVNIGSLSRPCLGHCEHNSFGCKRVVRTWLGLKMVDLNDMVVAHLKEKNPEFPNVVRGVLISMVSPKSPADRAGFHPGDVVIEFGGRHVGSIKEIVNIMGDKVGKPFVAVVKRGNDTCVTLTVIPEEANPEM